MVTDQADDSDDQLCWKYIESITRSELIQNNKVPQLKSAFSDNPEACSVREPRFSMLRPSSSVANNKRTPVLNAPINKNALSLFERVSSSCSEEFGIISQINRKTKLKVDKGKYAIDGTIDLHGYSINVAYDTLVDFVTQSYESCHKCLLVITGWGSKSQGENSIKSSLYQWLLSDKLIHMVLYYTQATAAHGGKGAFYVLLRSKNKTLLR